MVQKIGGLIAFSLLTLTMLYIYRQFTNIYSYVESSEHWRYLAATLVVGAMGYSLMLRHALVKFAFWGIVAALGGSVAINAAIPLNLINYYPPLWNIVILLVITGGTVFAVLIIGVGARHHLGTPLLVALGDAPRLPKPAESQPKLSVTFGETDRDVSDDEDDDDGGGERDPQQRLANPDNTETIESLLMLNETLTVLKDNKGNLAAAGRALNLSPPGVSERIKRLYKVEPRLVRLHAPDWVKRNIKEDAEV